MLWALIQDMASPEARHLFARVNRLTWVQPVSG